MNTTISAVRKPRAAFGRSQRAFERRRVSRPKPPKGPAGEAVELRAKQYARKVRATGKIRVVEVMTDFRRKLPYVARARADHFEIFFVANDERLTSHVAYELAGW